jgi:hypothetical protein
MRHVEVYLPDITASVPARDQGGTVSSNPASSSGESPVNLLHAPKRAVSKQMASQRGTDSSNPAPSTGESCANQTFSASGCQDLGL